jgi:hypothetical protein
LQTQLKPPRVFLKIKKKKKKKKEKKATRISFIKKLGFGNSKSKLISFALDV